MIGEAAFEPYAVNTFSGRGKRFDADAITKIHYVHPHQVSSYTRSDGTFVRGYFRDGDGNTDIDRRFGYYAWNPGAKPQILKKG